MQRKSLGWLILSGTPIINMGHTCPYVIVVLGSAREVFALVEWNAVTRRNVINLLNANHVSYRIFCFSVNEQWVVAIAKASELVSTVLFAACVFTYQTTWQACLWALQRGWSVMVVLLNLRFPDDEYQLHLHLLFLKVCCFDIHWWRRWNQQRYE